MKCNYLHHAPTSIHARFESLLLHLLTNILTFVPRRESLYKLVKLSKKTSVEQITLEDLEAFKRHCYTFYRTNTMIAAAMREVRCFLRYHKKRGANCLRPDVVGDLQINYK